MITVFGTGQNGRPLLFLGLTKQNVAVLGTRPLDYYSDSPIPVQDIFILYGEDGHDLLRQFEAAGLTISAATKAAVARDPR